MKQFLSLFIIIIGCIKTIKCDCEEVSLYYMCTNVKNINEILQNISPRDSPWINVINNNSDITFTITDDIYYKNVSKLIHGIDLSKAKNVILSDNFLYNFPLLHSLYISYLNLDVINDAWFQNNNEILNLKINNNRIRRIMKSTFNHLKKLYILNLSSNIIDFIELDTFSEMNDLYELNLENNILTKVNFGISHVRSLNLRKNYITEIKKNQFGEMLDLENLNLSENYITKIDNDAFLNNTALSFINLSNNQIKVLHLSLLMNTISDQISIVTFNFNNNFIRNIIEAEYKNYPFNVSINLQLSNNSIKQIDADLFESLSIISYLYLDNNNISSLPENAFRHLQSNLKYLSICNNRLTALKPKTFNLPHLCELILEGNLINEMAHNTFTGENKITKLSLKNNKLIHINGELLSKLTNLAALDVSQNDLEVFETNKLKSDILSKLDLSQNRLTTLNDELFDFNINLINLNISHNRIRTLSVNYFKNLNNLTKLDASHNKIGQIDTYLFNATSLRELNIGHNELKYLTEEHFLKFPFTLQHLHLNDNFLSYLPTLTNYTSQRLKEIFLSGNPWQCKCLDQLIIWLDKHSIKYENMNDEDLHFNGGQPICLIAEATCVRDYEFVLNNNIIHDYFLLKNQNNKNPFKE